MFKIIFGSIMLFNTLMSYASDCYKPTNLLTPELAEHIVEADGNNLKFSIDWDSLSYKAAQQARFKRWEADLKALQECVRNKREEYREAIKEIDSALDYFISIKINDEYSLNKAIDALDLSNIDSSFSPPRSCAKEVGFIASLNTSSKNMARNALDCLKWSYDRILYYRNALAEKSKNLGKLLKAAQTEVAPLTPAELAESNKADKLKSELDRLFPN